MVWARRWHRHLDHEQDTAGNGAEQGPLTHCQGSKACDAEGRTDFFTDEAVETGSLHRKHKIGSHLTQKSIV